MDCFQTNIQFDYDTTPKKVVEIVQKASESSNLIQQLDKVPYPDGWLYNTLQRQSKSLTIEEKHSLNSLILHCYVIDETEIANRLMFVGDEYDNFIQIGYDSFVNVFSGYIINNDKFIDTTDLINLTKVRNYLKSIDNISKLIQQYNCLICEYNDWLITSNILAGKLHYANVSELLKRLCTYYEKEITQCEKHRYETYSRRARDNSCNDCLPYKNIFVLMEKLYAYFYNLRENEAIDKFVDLHENIERIEKDIETKVDEINKLFEDKEEINELFEDKEEINELFEKK